MYHAGLHRNWRLAVISTIAALALILDVSGLTLVWILSRLTMTMTVTVTVAVTMARVGRR